MCSPPRSVQLWRGYLHYLSLRDLVFIPCVRGGSRITSMKLDFYTPYHRLQCLVWVALESFLSNLIQGPSPELVYEPYKQKSLIGFKLALLLLSFLRHRVWRWNWWCVKTQSKNKWKMLETKTFTKCKNQQLFTKKEFFFFSILLRFHAANIKEISLNYELLML